MKGPGPWRCRSILVLGGLYVWTAQILATRKRPPLQMPTQRSMLVAYSVIRRSAARRLSETNFCVPAAWSRSQERSLRRSIRVRQRNVNEIPDVTRDEKLFSPAVPGTRTWSHEQ